MYNSIYHDSITDTIHVWGDGRHNDLGHKEHPNNMYAYISDVHGDYVTIDGYNCKKIPASSISPEAIKMGMIYENNVPPITRFIIDNYTEHNDTPTNMKILFMDIEVLKGPNGHSTTTDATGVINAISYKLSGEDTYYCLLLDESVTETITNNHIIQINGSDVNVKLTLFKREEQLLSEFMTRYSNFGHNIISGWNVEYYDMPYIHNRMTMLLGGAIANKLSPIGKIKRGRPSEFNDNPSIIIAGVSILDYLPLYKKFTYEEKSNYRLDTIALAELGRGKIEYDGDLNMLYHSDIEKFIMYSVVDVELIQALDNKLDFINTAVATCHECHCSYEDIYYTSKYIDAAILTYCKLKGLIASSNKSDNSGKAEGAFVREPIPGLYNWVYDLDLTSLYPMNIITLNISPETKFAQILNWDEKSFITGNDTDKIYDVKLFKDNTILGEFDDIFTSEIKDRLELSHDELQLFINKFNTSIASNGCLYSQDKKGVIPSILSEWFNDRIKYQSSMKEAIKNGDKQLTGYYDKKQLIKKIQLNSVYGVLLLSTFRFYDKSNGEAVTISGQSVINYSADVANWYYNKQLKDVNCEYEIIMEDNSIKKLNGLSMVNTKSGRKYVFALTENDEII